MIYIFLIYIYIYKKYHLYVYLQKMLIHLLYIAVHRKAWGANIGSAVSLLQSPVPPETS